ncbi:DapH/DapD/GlmU-related protein [Flavobacterium sp.]|uniref:acyltransferase n=1 Tax=Flavobacterium sp. TaxID=239 RepID=UPI002604271D|nr:acyltransferase [Flavobacterium sp.]
MSVFSKIKVFCFVNLRIIKYKLLSDCKRVSGNAIMHHPLLLKGEGKISFGENVQIGVFSSPNFYSHYSYIEARYSDSEICIGSNVAINNAFSVVAYAKVTIGNEVLIGVNCSIIDNDGHELAFDKRNESPVGHSVVIENNVFIGSNVTILKGVTVGENAVVGNGTVVTRNVPKNAIVTGNPARIIRMLPH